MLTAEGLPEQGREAITVLVFASSPILRAGLRALLEEVEGVAVVGETGDLAEAESLAEDAQILLIAPGLGAAEESGALMTEWPSLALLLLVEEDLPAARAGQTKSRARREIIQDIPSGRAWGMLSMEASAEELSAAVHALAEGLLVGAPSLVEPLLTAGAEASAVAIELGQEEEQLIEPLTEREGEVLQLLARGLPNKQIALALGISEHTVKFHISGIYSKLGATNRTEAVRLGVRKGLVVL